MRGALMDAARELTVARGFDGFSLRNVADRARVNQAMVRYYFGDRHGLISALLDDGFARLAAAASRKAGFREIFSRLAAALNEMPWLPILMMQTVYVEGEMRERFLAHHAPKMVAMLGRDLPGDDEPPGFAILAALSLLVFPQLARPVVEPVFDVSFDDDFARAYADYTARLFKGGAT